MKEFGVVIEISVQLNAEELSDILFFIIWKNNYCQHRPVSLIILYQCALEQFERELLKTKPYIQLIKSWLEIGVRYGFLQAIVEFDVRYYELTPTGMEYVESDVLNRSYALNLINSYLKESIPIQQVPNQV